MSGEPQLFRVNPESQQSDRIEEVDFARLGLRERRDIQEWVAANPGILGDDLLIITKEFSGFDRTNERLDLLAVDSLGKLVVIELKRDDTGADTHWQAIKYASYFQHATADSIIRMAAEHRGESEDDAATKLLQHLGADDLSALNNDQRIILASHRFAREVTSAAVWLNEKIPTDDFITCIKLTPYRDAQNDSLFVQASTIIPVPGVDDYLVGIGSSQQPERIVGRNSFAANLKKAYDRNRDDEVTHFLRRIGQAAIAGLPDGIRPDRTSKWGAGWPNDRYYHLWYSRQPWSNHGCSYQLNLIRQESTDPWDARVRFISRQDIKGGLDGITLHPDQTTWQNGNSITVPLGSDSLSEELAEKMAEMLRNFIEQITPIIDDLENEVGEEESAES